MKSIEFEPGKFEVLKALLKAAHKVGVPVALIGASARDAMLAGCHNIQPTRKTMDVDCAAKVNDWQHYRKLRTFMLDNMDFREDSDNNHPERLVDTEGNWIDILPFGGAEDKKKGSIFWSDQVEMSVVGFDDAFASAEQLEISSGSETLKLPIITLPGIVLLKIIAWVDRENDLQNRRKHARDIHTIILHYSSINAGRLNAGTDSDLAETYDNALLTGARLLGRDMCRLCSENTEKAITEFLEKQSSGRGECIFLQDMRRHCLGRFSIAKDLTQALYNGFSEVRA